MQELQQYLDQFSAALGQRDWHALASLQSQLESVVQAAALRINTDEQRDLYTRQLQQLNNLVAEAARQAGQDRDELAGELKQLNQRRSAAQSYRSSE